MLAAAVARIDRDLPKSPPLALLAANLRGSFAATGSGAIRQIA